MNNQMVGSGYKLTLLPDRLGGYYWSVRRFRKLLAEGRTNTEDEAKGALKAALGDATVLAAQETNERSPFMHTLRYYAAKRPYIATYVTDLLLDRAEGITYSRMLKEAHVQEKRLYKEDLEKIGNPVRLPTHHMAKEAYKVANKILDCFFKLGFTKLAEGAIHGHYVLGSERKLRKWASDMLGDRYARDPVTLPDDEAA